MFSGLGFGILVLGIPSHIHQRGTLAALLPVCTFFINKKESKIFAVSLSSFYPVISVSNSSLVFKVDVKTVKAVTKITFLLNL